MMLKIGEFMPFSACSAVMVAYSLSSCSFVRVTVPVSIVISKKQMIDVISAMIKRALYMSFSGKAVPMK